MLTPYEHFLYDQGTIAQREKYSIETGCDWNKIFELKEKLIKESKVIKEEK